MKRKANIAQEKKSVKKESTSGISDLDFVPPWPEWNDADIDAETWDAGRDKTGAAFEDPIGHGYVSEEVHTWKRITDLNFPASPVIAHIDGQHEQVPDLLSSNIHILHHKLIRLVIISLMNLQYLSENDPFPIEFQGERFTSSRGQPWKPWHHIYSKCSSKSLPIPNEFGKYIVRLFYLGSWRKITVDDYVPFDKEGTLLLPQLKNSNEMWPMIISKAILRVLLVENNRCKEVTDFDVTVLLTGWAKEVQKLQDIPSTVTWLLFQKLLLCAPEEDALEAKMTNQNDGSKTKPAGKNSKSQPLKSSSSFGYSEIGKCVVLACFPDMPQIHDPFKKMTPCLSHPVLITDVRDIDYGEILLQFPLWKRIRWVDWAVKNRLLPYSKWEKVKSIKLYSAYACKTLPVLNTYSGGFRYTLSGEELKDTESLEHQQVEAKQEARQSRSVDNQQELTRTRTSDLRNSTDVNQENAKGNSKRLSEFKGNKKKGRTSLNITSAVPNENEYNTPNDNESYEMFSIEKNEKEIHDPEFWCDINDILNDVSLFNIYYRISSFEHVFRMPPESFNLDDQQGTRSRKSISRKASTATLNRFLNSAPKARDFFFLVIDSSQYKKLLISLSALFTCSSDGLAEESGDCFTTNAESRNTSGLRICYVIGEKYEWINDTIGETLFVLKSDGSRSILVHLSEGMHVVRIWRKFPVHYSLVFASSVPFTVCSMETMQELIIKPSSTLSEYAEEISEKFKSVLSQVKQSDNYDAEKHILSIEDFKKTYLPKTPLNAVSEIKEEYIHSAFENALVSYLETREMSSDKIKSVVSFIQNIFKNEEFGRQILEGVLENSSNDIDISGVISSNKVEKKEIEQFSEKSSSLSADQDKRSSSHRRPKKSDGTSSIKKDDSFYLDDTSAVIDILRNMITMFPELSHVYPFAGDVKMLVDYIDYVGTTRIGNTSFGWIPIARLVLNAHKEVFCSIHCFCSTEQRILYLVNNDTLERLPNMFSDIGPTVFKPNDQGYTIIILVPLSNLLQAEVSWKIRILGERGKRLIHSCTWLEKNECMPKPPTGVETLILQGKYAPSVRNTIYECVVTAMMSQFVTIKITLSNPDVNFKSFISTSDDEVLSEVTGVGTILIPVFCIKANDDAENANGEIKLFLRGEVLNNSWSFPEESGNGDNKIDQSAKMSTGEVTRRNSTNMATKFDSLPLLNNVKNIDLVRKSISENGSYLPDNLMPSWVVQIFVDKDKLESIKIKPDLRRQEQIARMRECVGQSDPERIKHASQLREDFLSSLKDAHPIEEANRATHFQSSSKLSILLEKYIDSNTGSDKVVFTEEMWRETLKQQDVREDDDAEETISVWEMRSKLKSEQNERISRCVAYLNKLRVETDDLISSAYSYVNNNDIAEADASIIENNGKKKPKSNTSKKGKGSANKK